MATGLDKERNGWGRSLQALCVVACAFAAVSPLNAGSGNLGRTNGQAGGGTVTLTQSTVFSITTSPGQAMIGPGGVVPSLVAAINADANFQATVITDPGDPNSASFSFLRAIGGGGEVSHMRLCETDPNIDNLGVVFPMGANPLVLAKVTSINADGNYRLTIQVSDPNGSFDQTFSTTSAPNNTAAGLNASVKSALQTAGFTVAEDGTNFTIQKPGSTINATRMSSSDTGVVSSCIELTAVVTTGSGVPTLPVYGLALLGLVLFATAVVLVRRNRSTGGLDNI